MANSKMNAAIMFDMIHAPSSGNINALEAAERTVIHHQINPHKISRMV